MTLNQAKSFLRQLNDLTVSMQSQIDFEDKIDDQVDDVVIPMLMDASDSLSRAIEGIEEQ